MAKKTPFLAIAICAMAMFPSHANANWLSVVKSIIGGTVGAVQIPVAQLSENPPPAPEQPLKPNTPPTPAEILASLNKLGAECKNIASMGVPCVVEGGRGTTPENARRVANRAAIAAMGMAINTYVSGESDLIRDQLEQDGIPTDVNEFDEKITLSVGQAVRGAQTYLTYVYIDEDASKRGGKTVYVATEVMVLNAKLFAEAIEEIALGKSISQRIIDETRKGVADRLKNVFKKK
jgi:hypothetical protein